MKQSLRDRLASKSRHDASGCVLWTGHKSPAGYGRIGANGANRLAHRMAFVLSNGPIPDGKMVLHRCDNRACINVDHLFLGNQIDNMRDMKVRRRGPGVNLFPLDVLAIRAHLSMGKSTKGIADMFGVEQCTVRGIRTGKTHWSRGIVL